MRQEDFEFLGKGAGMLRRFARNGHLITFPELGIGYYPVLNYDKYDKDYFVKYEGYARTDRGKAINGFRASFVRHYMGAAKTICDVGIGSGQFVASFSQSNGVFGYDVNRVGIDWLVARNQFADPYERKFDVMTFWDSLEHIPDFDRMLINAEQWVFISMPIYKTVGDITLSRHFRKDEHFWYFTHLGLINVMYSLNFLLAATSNKEQDYGREAITTFAFRRC